MNTYHMQVNYCTVRPGGDQLPAVRAWRAQLETPSAAVSHTAGMIAHTRGAGEIYSVDLRASAARYAVACIMDLFDAGRGPAGAHGAARVSCCICGWVQGAVAGCRPAGRGLVLQQGRAHTQAAYELMRTGTAGLLGGRGSECTMLLTPVGNLLPIGHGCGKRGR